MESENWIPVVGFEGFYEVSDLGGVRSVTREVTQLGPHGETVVRRINSRPLKPTPVDNGYSRVTLKAAALGIKLRYCYVHRLVLEAFVGPCPEGQQVRHFPDGTRSNNRLSNLSWGTPKENQADRQVQGTAVNGDDCHLSKLTAEQATEVRRRLDSGERIRDVARELGMSEGAIGHIKARRSWSKALSP